MSSLAAGLTASDKLSIICIANVLQRALASDKPAQRRTEQKEKVQLLKKSKTGESGIIRLMLKDRELIAQNFYFKLIIFITFKPHGYDKEERLTVLFSGRREYIRAG